MGNIFKFKQFEVDQEGCAMRINTDGVLLAAMATHSDPRRVLDIGTGTGVLAMMMAQRFSEAKVDAVEIDERASQTANKNFISSAFAKRLRVFNTDIADYETDTKYDLIISNPPFFVNDLKNPEGRKSLARHANELFYISLLKRADQLLGSDGVIWMILPVKQADAVIGMSGRYSLSLQQEVSICSDASKPVIRKMICLGRGSSETHRSVFYIYESKAMYTEAYRQQLKDFFLAF